MIREITFRKCPTVGRITLPGCRSSWWLHVRRPLWHPVRPDSLFLPPAGI